MKKQYILVLVIVIGLALVGLGQHYGVININQLIRTGDTVEQQVQGSEDNNPARETVVPAALEQGYLEQLLATITAEQRKALLEDSEAFRQFIDQEALNLSLLQAARSSNLKSDPAAQFLVQRGADNVYREIYLTGLINSKIPQDFPNDQQIQEYYDNNKDNLKTVERVSIWQIFLPSGPAMDEAAVKAVASEADNIAGQIRADKLDFSAAALQYSQHDPSRLNGGYMGIIKMSELIPEIHKVVSELDAGETSAAVKSSMGYHIIRKGEVFPANDLALDQIRDEVKNLMINQARNQLRTAINTEVMKTYPVPVDETSVEQWREALLSKIK